MKKILILVCLLLLGCDSKTEIKITEHNDTPPLEYVKEELKFTIPQDAQILETYDTHGGFFGDGDFYLAVQLNQAQMTKFIQEISQNQEWKKLPLSETAAYMYAIKSEVSMKIPENPQNGYYYYHDFYAEWHPNEQPRKLSPNYAIAILNLDTNRLFVLCQILIVLCPKKSAHLPDLSNWF